jgi:hypothetical protein
MFNCLCSLISSFIILISPLIFMQSYLFTLSDSFIYDYIVIFQHSFLQSHSNIHLYMISFPHSSLCSLIPPTIFAQFYPFTHFYSPILTSIITVLSPHLSLHSLVPLFIFKTYKTYEIKLKHLK